MQSLHHKIVTKKLNENVSVTIRSVAKFFQTNSKKN